MTQKAQLRNNIRRLNKVKTWQLVLLLLVAVFVSMTFLRLNNVGMVERRAAVEYADKSGVTDTVHQRLYDLQRYSAAHMNASSGPVYLEQLYKRDSQRILEEAMNTSNPNGNIYAKADDVCRPQFGNSYSIHYQNCFMAELDKYPAADNVDISPTMPNQQLYRHNFVSPLWSPDFAGWSVLVCIGIILVIIFRIITLGLLRLLLKHRYRDV